MSGVTANTTGLLFREYHISFPFSNELGAGGGNVGHVRAAEGFIPAVAPCDPGHVFGGAVEHFADNSHFGAFEVLDEGLPELVGPYRWIDGESKR